MTDEGMALHPFIEVAASAQQVLENGGAVFQQFLCEKCLTKQTMPDKNKFFTEGQCEECGHVTNIMENGCNYFAVFGP